MSETVDRRERRELSEMRLKISASMDSAGAALIRQKRGDKDHVIIVRAEDIEPLAAKLWEIAGRHVARKRPSR
jgi:hypothetical protein